MQYVKCFNTPLHVWRFLQRQDWPTHRYGAVLSVVSLIRDGSEGTQYGQQCPSSSAITKVAGHLSSGQVMLLQGSGIAIAPMATRLRKTMRRAMVATRNLSHYLKLVLQAP